MHGAVNPPGATRLVSAGPRKRPPVWLGLRAAVRMGICRVEMGESGMIGGGTCLERDGMQNFDDNTKVIWFFVLIP